MSANDPRTEGEEEWFAGSTTGVTRLLSAIEQGDPEAAGRLWPLVYEALHKLAAAQMTPNNPARRSMCKSI